MKTLSRDAKGFIEGITKYIHKEGKTEVLPKVQALLGKVAAQSEKETTAHVASSVSLNADEQQALERFLVKLVGHPVTLSAKVDGALLGGLKITIGDWLIDTSFSHQLDLIAQDIL